MKTSTMVLLLLGCVSVGATSSGGLIQVENSVKNAGEETDFLRDCRVLAEIAEKGGVLDKCMGGGTAVDQDCQDTLTNSINAADGETGWLPQFGLPRRNDCYTCFIDTPTDSECDAQMSGCKSTVRKHLLCNSNGNPDPLGNQVCTDSAGDAEWEYSGPETSGSIIITTTPDDYKKSDRLYGCFGLTGDGLDPAMLQEGHEVGLLEQRAERGTLNTTAFMKSSSSKA